jgi:hypothetical protein
VGVKNSELADLIATTLSDLPKGQFEVMWDSQGFEFCAIYQEKRRKIDGGDKIIRNVVLDRIGTASYRRLYDVDVPTVENVHKKIEVPWTQVGTNYSWDVLEIMRNKSSAKGFIDLMESRRIERLWDFAELIEERGWASPTNATDDKYPYGVPYYLNMLDAGSTTGGFSGQTIRYQDSSTGTVCAGLDAGIYAKWRNYADVFTKIDNKFLRSLRKAFLLTRFKAPRIVNAPGQDSPGGAGQVKIYVNSDQAVELMDLADKRDDNSGPGDLAGKALINGPDGVSYFNRRPVTYIPQLDGVAYSPIYCVDWSKLIPFVQDGYWMVEGEPMIDRGQHTTFTVFTDGCHNNLCINRRTAGFCLHTPIPA